MFDSIAKDIPYHTLIDGSPVRLDLKRLDLIHPHISGNKFYKLKYNLIEAKKRGCDRILTFGGAFSNHIAASAYAAHHFDFKSIGIIRGQELAYRPLNATLKTAQHYGMQLEFMSREQYRQRDQSEFLHALQSQYPSAFIIPEGGTNALAIQGSKEILSDTDRLNYDVICCAVGTGGTLAGLIEASHHGQYVIGFSALKGDFLHNDVQRHTNKTNWHILDDYCFGGYAKTSSELFNFIDGFEQKYQIPLEQVYTAKMLYGLLDLIQKNDFDQGTRILALHTGGLQGRRHDIGVTE
ncbi:1-aminocyclopropane-1-carboxylate deaminase/D-cysteine desulfhydrase-like pyridoxal-dependent ACC family enzyme [Acinetobacter baylyi]|uniref:1-aminocyclopropane-1-carboxylate deaminase/D-cysteine desulfhydrase-like pyridoxal-dependent ACC family enzyme n=1 Tax=Acinetobacter baylyi TaxID=202950 RepID=A0ABU0UVA1_ACIBI|nr:pyridoxal-phosphate dependent enzyme [Acinetobacter baylyi]MDQ1208488.1 1-aminocyclopropane-1-carboxylate deaminase/D-cysteine desulfhydrase-like pyridoxal-dependent ACC family enzyme [Acinetobacter baylyi]MDR6107923.1 1-aminocyclopropane-1-carboxylate deaminase/D-cysteine desulfhydrase-like pyridoxal-dependent ACC family enzyme [Acinetobacter baylyi]MDR6185362.1 1-aminocyclopropane-1-carboxylate deaminase/D-cysteine desulfhydrase-like pyridoxal-dependent ACC family enzyme [Acinetobacter bayl